MEKKNIGYFILVLFHLVGFFGMLHPDLQSIMASLTPLHMLLCFGILAWFHTGGLIHFASLSAVVWIIGMLAEIIGVNTGLLFGDYSYSSVLGPSVIGVPAIIGINWFLLCYSVSIISNSWKILPFFHIIFGASLVTALDYLIEPVAIQLHFWSWNTSSIPVYNYISWFFVSAVILLFIRSKVVGTNRMAVVLLVSQFFFFLLLNIFLY